MVCGITRVNLVMDTFAEWIVAACVKAGSAGYLEGSATETHVPLWLLSICAGMLLICAGSALAMLLAAIFYLRRKEAPE